MRLFSIFLINGMLYLAGATALADRSLDSLETIEGVQSGRYEIHKATPAQAINPVQKLKKEKSLRRPSSEERQNSSQVVPAATVEEAKKIKNQDQEPVAEITEPTLTEQAQSLVSGKMEQVYDFYREQVHPDDIRNNRVEIEISPGFIYNDSKSNYSFRSYTSSYSAVSLKSNVWFTPLIGISGHYLFSMAADLNGNGAGQSRTPAQYEFLELSLNIRKFFGLSRKSNSLEFDLLYSDSKLKVPSDDTSHARLGSTGFGLGLNARLPTSASYAWVLGGNFFPRIQHIESATAAGLNSGSSCQSTRIGLDLGGEFKFTRESQFIWKLAVSSEKNLFNGLANLPDPVTGSTPSNVSVTNTMLMLNLGYRWGQ